jgi:hypothetical protein
MFIQEEVENFNKTLDDTSHREARRALFYDEWLSEESEVEELAILERKPGV